MKFEIENLKNLYEGEGKYSDLLKQYHWFYELAEFDPKTLKKTLYLPLSLLLKKIRDEKLYYDSLFNEKEKDVVSYHDTIWHICQYCKKEIKNIIKQTNEFPQREHINLHISKVKELDVNSIIKINKKPGRNFKQKLAGKPYIYAVHRYQSLDLSENRLFKDFVKQLVEVLNFRKDKLKDDKNEIYSLIPIIKQWLNSPKSKTISEMKKLEVNNTMIFHRFYKAVFSAWKKLKEIDNEIEGDLEYVEENEKIIKFWSLLAKNNIKIADMPIKISYEDNKLLIKSYLEGQEIYLYEQNIKLNDLKSLEKYIAEHHIKEHNSEKKSEEEISEAVCIDFNNINPKWATTTQEGIFEDNFIWQRWKKNGNEGEDIISTNSNSICTFENVETIYLPDIFVKNSEYLNTAMQEFCKQLKNKFHIYKPFIWLIPDLLQRGNSESKKIIYNNINNYFIEAEPLPRSVACLFAKGCFKKIEKDKNKAVVIDYICDKVTATVFHLEEDNEEDNKNKLLELENIAAQIKKGKIWVRITTIEIEDIKTDNDFCFIDNFNGKWISSKQRTFEKIKDEKIIEKINNLNLGISLKNNEYNIIHTTDCLNELTKAGIELYELQKNNGCCLWKDKLPRISTKYIDKDKRYYVDFDFVKDQTYKYVRRENKKEEINIAIKGNKFTLKKGKNSFPINFSLDNKNKQTKYIATCVSEEEQECNLNFTYDYTTDKYKFKFIPEKNSQKTIEAKLEDDIAKNIKTPEFPSNQTWEALKTWPDDIEPGKTDNLLEHSITAEIGMNNSKSIAIILTMWFNQSIQDIQDENYKEKIKKQIASLNKFKDNAEKYILLLSAMHKDAPDFIIKILEEYIDNDKYIGEEKNKNTIRRSVAYYLGDCSKQEQKNILDELFNKKITKYTLDILAYAIWRQEKFIYKLNEDKIKKILKCFDKIIEDEKYIENIFKEKITSKKLEEASYKENYSDRDKKDMRDYIDENIDYLIKNNFDIKYIINKIKDDGGRINNSKMIQVKRAIERLEKKRYGEIIRLIELLYGLLRLRNSSDEYLKNIFVPGNERTNKYVDWIDKIIKTIVDENEKIKNKEIKILPEKISRLEFDETKKEEEGLEKIPDLLYALRAYLTCDTNSNISIKNLKTD